MDPQSQPMLDSGSAVCPHLPPDCVKGPSDAVLRKVFSPCQRPFTSMLAGEFTKPAVIGYYGSSRRLSATPETVKEILLSVLESSGGATHQPRPQSPPPAAAAVQDRTAGARALTGSGSEDPPAGASSDSDDGYGGDESPLRHEDGGTAEQGPSRLGPDAGPKYLPRSSPVISRRSRWPSGVPTPGSSPADQSPSPSPAGPVLDESRAGAGPPPRQVLLAPAPHPEKPRSTSLSANFNWLFPTGLSLLPFRASGLVDGGLKPRSSSDTHIYPVLCKDTAIVSREPSHLALSPDDILRTSCDLDKENAHFIIVDMVLEALESTKCALWSQGAGQAGRGQSGCPVGLPEEETGSGPLSKRHSESVASSDSGYEGFSAHQSLHIQKEPGNEIAFTSRTLEKQNPDADTGTTSSLQSSSCVPVSPCSAENLATQLVRIFRKQWLHSESQRHGLGNSSSVLQESFPQFPVDVMDVEHSLTLAEEIKQKSRMRGTLIWAPPRFQIIFNIHPPQKRSTVVASQHYLCAGCGTQVEPRYIKKLRYCEYLGKYFCDCCHNDSESVIPGHILMKWDFGKYLVCNFSKHLLYSIWHNPLFNVSCINKTLYAKAKELDRFRELQEQLLAIKKLLVTCRLSECVLQEFGQLPEHLTRELHLFSLDDLVRVKRGLLLAQARALLRVASAHVETCELCLAKGFICEFCKGKDVLFPFQKETCKRCEDCKACFHKDCFKEEECPKCLRIQARKKLKDAFSLDVL